jgi:hypothetical protein
MSDFESRIKAIFATGEDRGARLREHLSNNDDLIGVVLRGHLVLEELLFAAVSAHCQEPEHLKEVRLRFPQLVSLLRALEKISAVPSNYWNALLEFNTLRNQLAHRLEPKDIEACTARFVSFVSLRSEHKFPEPHSSREALQAALHYLIGGLEVVATWHAAVEALIHERATGESGNGAAA